MPRNLLEPRVLAPRSGAAPPVELEDEEPPVRHDEGAALRVAAWRGGQSGGDAVAAGPGDEADPLARRERLAQQLLERREQGGARRVPAPSEEPGRGWEQRPRVDGETLHCAPPDAPRS